MLSFVPMFTSVPMVVPKAQVLSLSNPQMMLATQFNNSMVTSGKAVPSKFARIASLVLQVVEDSAAVVVVVASGVVALEVVSELEAADSEVVAVDSVVEDSAVDAEALEVASAEVALVVVHPLELTSRTLQPSPTPSLTMLLPVPREVKSSTFAT